MNNLEKTKATSSTFWVGVIMLVFGNIGFSLKAVTIKLLYRYHIDTISVLGLRMVFSLPFFIITLLILRSNKAYSPLPTRDILKISGLGVLSYYLSSMLDFLGLQYVSAGVERLILFTYPTIVVLISALYLKEKIQRYQIVALLLTYIGIVIALVAERGLGAQNNFLLGALFIFSCAFTYAFYVVGTGEMLKRVGSVRFTAIAMVAATIPAVVHNFISNGLNLFHFEQGVYQLTFWMVIVSTVIPIFLLVEGIKRVGSNTSSIIGFIGPISTIYFANLFLDEPVTVLKLVGTSVVIYGIFYITRKTAK